MTTPICPYCNQPARLVPGAAIYPHRPDLYKLNFWQCQPCDAYVGCHKAGSGSGYARGDGTEPLGRLANAHLRMWKGNAHTVFDPFWRGGERSLRSVMYAKLARELGIEAKDCHIGMFDVEMCKRVVQICARWREQGEKA
jgi:hypothetical protein